MNKEKLALLGGTPCVSRPKPHYVWPLVTARTEQAVLRQMHEDVAIYGRYGVFERFENRWSQYHGRRFSLLTNSGTNGLWSMFVGCDLKPGDEVLCPAYTFYATATPLFFTGAVPVLVDSDESGNVDPAKVEALITDKTRALIVTHMWGIPCRMDVLAEICKRRGILLLEDASHAHGARYQGKLAGTWGDAAVWSLGGQKIITGGEGGVMSTDNEDIHARAVMLGHYNKRAASEVPDGHPLKPFALTGMGLKLRASPMNVAMANEQFDHLDAWLAQKRVFARMINERLAGLPGVASPVVPEGGEPSWYSYVMQYRTEELSGLSIERFHEALVAEGCVEANLPTSTCPLNWLAMFQSAGDLHPAYKESSMPAYRPGQFPCAEKFARQAITMPVWAQATDESLVVSYLDAIEKVVRNHQQLL